MHKERINKGIILAAGDGDRMGSLTAICPKGLLLVNGKEQLIRPLKDTLKYAENHYYQLQGSIPYWIILIRPFPLFKARIIACIGF